MTDYSQSPIGIRDITSIEEMGAVEELQREVWACADVDVVPRMMLHPAREVGGTLVGAYDGARLVGFAFGFVGLERGRLVLHSHMLAVKPEYRGRALGSCLKLAQRERALAEGIKLMTWTFDPLQSRNAHLNFARLGVVSDSYRVNYYGDISTSPLHRATGTDRLWVTWHLDSPRVLNRINSARAAAESVRDELERAAPLVRFGADGSPVVKRLTEAAHGGLVTIEIPDDIDALREQDAEVALRWRAATRDAFQSALAEGYVVEEFFRVERDGRRGGAYLLRRLKGDG
ncbi:MAG: GNAT family N-acetyltransferase [Pyrinomonadaceae bacterium]